MAKNLQEIETEEEELYYDGVGEELPQMLSAVMKTAIKLTKLVVEVRLKNGAKLKDSDIYDIYQTAFHKVMVQFPEE